MWSARIFTLVPRRSPDSHCSTLSLPSTTTRSPFRSEAATCCAKSPHASTEYQFGVPSTQVSPSLRLGLLLRRNSATRSPCTDFSVGSPPEAPDDGDDVFVHATEDAPRAGRGAPDRPGRPVESAGAVRRAGSRRSPRGSCSPWAPRRRGSSPASGSWRRSPGGTPRRRRTSPSGSSVVTISPGHHSPARAIAASKRSRSASSR